MGTLMGTLWERAQCADSQLLNFQEEMARPKRFELLTPRFVVWGLHLIIPGYVHFRSPLPLYGPPPSRASGYASDAFSAAIAGFIYRLHER
jgi:hypothetical protein